MDNFSLFEFGLYSYKFEFRSGRYKFCISIPFNYFTPKRANRPSYKHFHAKYEVIYMRNESNSESKFIVIPPHFEHYTVTSNQSNDLYVSSFQFSIDNVIPSAIVEFATESSVFENFYYLRELIEINDTFEGKQRIASIERELIDKSPAYFEKINAELLLLMTDLARSIKIDNVDLSAPKRCFDDIRLDIIDCFFIENYSRYDCNRKELADVLHVSERQCYRILQDNYHLTFSDLLLRTRMEVADALRKTTRIRAEQIADLVGYRSTSAFLTAFYNYFNLNFESASASAR